MKNFDTRAYSVSDFVEWNQTKLLDLSPKFQRRSVWTEKAKSYLVDTVIRGKPIPKVLMMQSLELGRSVRTVVDGQQRIRAILAFVAGDFKISKAHNKKYAGLTFSQLPDDIQSDFLQYEVGVDLLFNLSYEDILDIFARLNAYSVKLNSQELLNAKYLGYFKQAAYGVGYRYVRYWLDSGVLTDKEVLRMGEAELSSDLLVCFVGGIQAIKVIPKYYRDYDDNEAVCNLAVDKFSEIMGLIGRIYPAEDLRESNFRRVHLFYSLFCSLAHFKYGVSGLAGTPRIEMRGMEGKVRTALDEISARYDEVTSKDAVAPSPEYVEFINNSRRATTDAAIRRSRSDFICKKIIEAL